MKLICSKCSNQIPAANINVGTDLAQCSQCGQLHKVSELVDEVVETEDLEQPAGSKIVFDKTAGGGTFYIPRSKLALAGMVPLFFSIFWLGFIAFWTFGAWRGGGGFFALFSIPFWLVGIGMFVAGIVTLTEKQTLVFERERFTLNKKNIIFTRRKSMAYDEIDSIELETVASRSGYHHSSRHRYRRSRNDAYAYAEIPTITHGVKKTRFGLLLSEPEKKWLVNILKALVFKKTGEKV